MAGQRKNKKRILVCGGTGFIGRNIAEYFATKSEFEVFATFHHQKPFPNPGIRFLKADLTKREDVVRVIKGKEILIQSAATTSGSKDIINRPHYHVTDNAVMNSLILRAAHEQKIKHLVFFSCSIMYPSGESLVKESDFDPNGQIYPDYFGAAWTKIYIEKMCEFYSGIGKTKYTVIRHSNVYGPHDKFDLEKSHVFGATMAKVMNVQDGKEILIWGRGEEERDLLYVSDLVNFVKAALKNQKSRFEIFNVGSGALISVKDLAAKVIARSGKKIRLSFDFSKPVIKFKLCLDSSKAKKRMGWAALVPLDEGIKKTMDWYNKNIL